MTREKDVSQGKNLTLARKWKNLSQSDLALMLNVHQTDVSDWEKLDVIDENILDKISKAMNIPSDFFTDFDMSELISTFHVTNKNDTITSGDNATGNEIMQSKNIQNQNITNNYASPEIIEMYKDLLNHEKEIRAKEVKCLTKEVEALSEKIGRLKQLLANKK